MSNKIYQYCASALNGRPIYDVNSRISDNGVIVHQDGLVVIDWKLLSGDLERMKFILSAGYSIKVQSIEIQQRISRIIMSYKTQFFRALGLCGPQKLVWTAVHFEFPSRSHHSSFYF